MCVKGGYMKRHNNLESQESSKEELIPEIVVQSLYEDEGWSIVKIAKFFGISEPVVFRMLVGKEVSTTQQIKKKMFTEKCHTQKYKNSKFQELSKEGLMPEIVIQSLYEDEGLSISKIAKQLGIPIMTVYRALKEFGVEIRDRDKTASEEMHKYWQNKKQSAEKSV